MQSSLVPSVEQNRASPEDPRTGGPALIRHCSPDLEILYSDSKLLSEPKDTHVPNILETRLNKDPAGLVRPNGFPICFAL